MGLLGFFLSLLTNGKEEHLSPHLYVLGYCTAAVSGTKLKFHESLRKHPQGASIMMQCMRMQAVKSMRTYQTGHILGIKKPKLEMVPPDRAYACFSHTQGPDLVFIITGSGNGTFFMAVSILLLAHTRDTKAFGAIRDGKYLYPAQITMVPKVVLHI
ncbi:hypothetical protein Pyn_07697 [Prunus yedoensis var. nudiflora]|uniref:Uncharacterized protein n=1 Tax=Prunus yedoensis var. nudiflora TaxID=2094558 RepID=A0A314Y4I2_PRUYE|nr:hypothetical protein Pyn_07697 [Prunus yedoensis var. nudiflora]